MGREKKKGKNPPGGPMASYLNQAESLKQEPQRWGGTHPGSLSSHVAGNVFIPDSLP